MSSPAPAPSVRSLRVFIATRDPVKGAHLRTLVLEAGHQVADSADGADVVLSEGSDSAAEDRLVLLIGGHEMDQAGSLAPEVTPAQLDAALRAVAAGLRVRSPSLPPRGLGVLVDSAPETLLTPREIDVLKCIGEGLTNKLIARRLNISFHTVKFHIESLLRKLGATTRAQALAVALESRRLGTLEF